MLLIDCLPPFFSPFSRDFPEMIFPVVFVGFGVWFLGEFFLAAFF